MCIWTGLFLFHPLSVKFSQLSYISILLAVAAGGGSGNTTGNRTQVGEEKRKWADEDDANILMVVIVWAMLGSYANAQDIKEK